MKVLLQFFFGIRKGYVKTLLLKSSLILPYLNSVASELSRDKDERHGV